jgi:hypothetical protein
MFIEVIPILFVRHIRDPTLNQVVGKGIILGPVSPGRDSSGDEVLEVFYFCIFIVFISETWTNPPSALIRYVNTSVRKKYVRNTDFFDDSFFMRTPYVCLKDDDDSFLFTPSTYAYKTMTITYAYKTMTIHFCLLLVRMHTRR